jgi:hypothetical protein
MREGRIEVKRKERRTFQRFRVSLPVDYARVKTKLPKAAVTENASEEGLMLHVQERLKIGTRLYISLLFSLGFKQTGVKALSQVMWQDTVLEEGWGRYTCGLKFLHIANEDLAKMKQLRMQIAAQP